MEIKSNLILYAEDDPEDRLIFYDALEETKVQQRVKFVDNGTEILDYFCHKGTYSDRRANPDPELVILDLNMPILDGYETLERIRKDKKFGLVPVVILSTSNSKEDVNKCYKLGANTFICKPDSYSKLVKVLSNLIEYWFEAGELPSI